MKVVGFVPARKGSTRVEEKNIQEILGVPLFLWAANNLSRVLDKKDIYIDSNSDEIIELAEKFGFSGIKRPEDLATNATDGNKFMLWEVSNVDADVYVQHLPPMPFLKQSTLQSAVEQVVDKKFDSAFAVIKRKSYQWSENGPMYDLKNIPNSFTLPDHIEEGMGLYVITKESILKNETRIGTNPLMVEIDQFESVDIDYPTDLEFARALAKGLGEESEYTNGISKYKS